MSWFTNLFKKPQLEIKESATRAVNIPQNNQPVASPRSYLTYAKEGYQNNIIAYRCISLIAKNASCIDLKVFKRNKDHTKGAPFANHPLQQLLYRPNPLMGGSRFIEEALSHYLISGNIFTERAEIGKGNYEMWLLRPDMMLVIPGAGGIPKGYEFKQNGRSLKFDFDHINPANSMILHTKTFNPVDLWHGQSPMEAAGLSIDSHNDATKFNKSMLQNGARPSAVMEYNPSSDMPAKLDDDAFYRLKEEIGSAYSGVVNAGRTMLLEGGLKFVQNQLSHTDISWAQGKEVSAGEIALAFGIPEQLVGVKGQQTFNNNREAKLALYEDAVLPVLSIYLEELTNWWRPIFGDDFYIGYDEETISALAIRRELVWDRVQKATHLTIDEKRSATGYAPTGKPAAQDEILVPSTLTFLNDVGLNTRQAGGRVYTDESGAAAVELTPAQIATILAILKEGLDPPATEALLLLAISSLPPQQAKLLAGAQAVEDLQPVDTLKKMHKAAYGD